MLRGLMSEFRFSWLVGSIAAVSVFGISATVVHQKIWFEVDLKEPGHFNPLGWYMKKWARLYSAYRLHYPKVSSFVWNISLWD
jgi:hypothetical protein